MVRNIKKISLPGLPLPEDNTFELLKIFGFAGNPLILSVSGCLSFETWALTSLKLN